MNGFLFTWNPNHWLEGRLAAIQRQLERDGHYTTSWRMAAHRRVQPGDRGWLVRVGRDPRGIIGIGEVAGEAWQRPPMRAGDRPRWVVELRVDEWHAEPLITLDELRMMVSDAVRWTPRASGTPLPPEADRALLALWQQVSSGG